MATTACDAASNWQIPDRTSSNYLTNTGMQAMLRRTCNPLKANNIAAAPWSDRGRDPVRVSENLVSGLAHNSDKLGLSTQDVSLNSHADPADFPFFNTF